MMDAAELKYLVRSEAITPSYPRVLLDQLTLQRDKRRVKLTMILCSWVLLTSLDQSAQIKCSETGCRRRVWMSKGSQWNCTERTWTPPGGDKVSRVPGPRGGTACEAWRDRVSRSLIINVEGGSVECTRYHQKTLDPSQVAKRMQLSSPFLVA
jgi:hypothetical protein